MILKEQSLHYIGECGREREKLLKREKLERIQEKVKEMNSEYREGCEEQETLKIRRVEGEF